MPFLTCPHPLSANVRSGADVLTNALQDRKEKSALHLSKYVTDASKNLARSRGRLALSKAAADVVGSCWCMAREHASRRTRSQRGTRRLRQGGSDARQACDAAGAPGITRRGGQLDPPSTMLFPRAFGSCDAPTNAVDVQILGNDEPSAGRCALNDGPDPNPELAEPRDGKRPP